MLSLSALIGSEVFRINLQGKGYTYVAHHGDNAIGEALSRVTPQPDSARSGPVSLALAYRSAISSSVWLAVGNRFDVLDEHNRRGITLLHAIEVRGGMNPQLFAAFLALTSLYADKSRFDMLGEELHILACENVNPILQDLRRIALLSEFSIDTADSAAASALAGARCGDLRLRHDIAIQGLKLEASFPFDDNLAFAAAAMHCQHIGGPFLVVLGKPRGEARPNIVCGSDDVHGFARVDLRMALAAPAIERQSDHEQPTLSVHFLEREPFWNWIYLRKMWLLAFTIVTAICVAVASFDKQSSHQRNKAPSMPSTLPATAPTLIEQVSALYESYSNDQGLHITIRNLFPTGLAVLDPETGAKLVRLAALIRTMPEYEILIEGHTDAVGMEKINIQLSLERALAVSKALEDAGISHHRITCRGLGSSRPLATAISAEAFALNRRIEITLSGRTLYHNPVRAPPP